MASSGHGCRSAHVDGELDLADLSLVGGCVLLVELVDDLVGRELVESGLVQAGQRAGCHRGGGGCWAPAHEPSLLQHASRIKHVFEQVINPSPPLGPDRSPGSSARAWVSTTGLAALLNRRAPGSRPRPGVRLRPGFDDGPGGPAQPTGARRPSPPRLRLSLVSTTGLAALLNQREAVPTPRRTPQSSLVSTTGKRAALLNPPKPGGTARPTKAWRHCRPQATDRPAEPDGAPLRNAAVACVTREIAHHHHHHFPMATISIDLGP